jgi:predicted ATP-grasp superfamily ATP-dependent carboligase
MLASLASLQREFVEPFISTSPFSIVRRFLDKRNQNQAAATAGLNVPESWFPATWGDLEQLPSGTNRKLIAKARYVGSASPFPFKVISANDGPQLVSLLKTFSIRPSDILVQDFIDGADKNVFIAMCFVGSNSETSVIVTGRKLIQSGKGSGGVMALGRAEPNKYLEDLTRLLITHLGYQGLIGVEFKYCERSNRYYFIEVSARPERFNGLAAAAGIDLTLIAYRDANRDDISQLVNIAQKDSIWIDVHGCWSAFRQNLNFGVLKQVMGTLLLRHRCAVFALDDWAPTMAAWRATARDIGRRIVRKFRKIFGAT